MSRQRPSRPRPDTRPDVTHGLSDTALCAAACWGLSQSRFGASLRGSVSARECIALLVAWRWVCFLFSNEYIFALPSANLDPLLIALYVYIYHGIISFSLTSFFPSSILITPHNVEYCNTLPRNCSPNATNACQVIVKTYYLSRLYHPTTPSISSLIAPPISLHTNNQSQWTTKTTVAVCSSFLVHARSMTYTTLGSTSESKIKVRRAEKEAAERREKKKEKKPKIEIRHQYEKVYDEPKSKRHRNDTWS